MSSPGRVIIHSLLIAFSFITAAAAADVSSNATHIRPVDPALGVLLRQAMAESPFFRTLVARLNESDVIVYLKFDRSLPSSLDGQLTFVGVGGGIRYVVVSVGWGRPDLRTISTLGHELQHAVEVAEHPEMVDSQSLGRGYATFGRKSTAMHGRVSYETTAAAEAGNRVWLEVSRGVTRQIDDFSPAYESGAKP